MGYCMYFTDADFAVKPENQEACLEAMRGMFGREQELMVVEYPWRARMGDTFPWYAWMNAATPDKWRDLRDALEDWRWDTELTLDGEVIITGFHGEKLGDDIILWRVITPYVKPGSYIGMRGEDGVTWRWTFDGEVAHRTWV